MDMRNEFPIDPIKLKGYNFKKYDGIPPPFDLIESVIQKSKLKRQYKFERVWKIPRGTISFYKNGTRELPAIYWHIFYDYDTVRQRIKRIKSQQNKSTVPTTANGIKTPNKHYLDEFKYRQPAG